jgi:predicted metal-dependent phosphoesterase TrpH
VSYKLDLHTHSYGSPDGSLKLTDYRYFLENKLLDYIAISDHNSIAAAIVIRDGLGALGDRIIIGEEIMTNAGEIIGLYLKQKVEAGMSPLETVRAIKAQGGIVYIPHPFETVRSGLLAPDLNEIVAAVDIIEIYNGRAVFQNRSKTAALWARQNATPGAASSDSHGRFGWGYTYTSVEHVPQRDNLCQVLSSARYNTRTVGWGILYPKINRIRKGLIHGTI